MKNEKQLLANEGFLNQYLEEIEKKDRSYIHYAIIDGASIEDIHTILPTRTDNYRSLFYRVSEDEYFSEESAPYLIQLDKMLLSWLLKTFYGKSIISFYQSDISLNELALHFSKHLIIQANETEQYESGEAYLAFYDPRVLSGFIQGLGANVVDFFAPIQRIYAEKERSPEIQCSWFLDDQGCCNEVQYSFEENAAINTKLLATETQKGFHYPDSQENPYTKSQITPFMQYALNRHEQNRNIEAMTFDLKKQFPELFENKKYQTMLDKVAYSVERMQKNGFSSYDKLFVLSAWELHYGANYEQRDSKGLLASICASPIIDEENKFIQFKARIEQLNLQPEGTA